MNLNRGMVTLAVAFWLLPASRADDRLPEGAVAVLDGRPLTETEFHAYIGREYRFEARAAELLQLMIQQTVIRAAAERKALAVTDGELKSRLAALDRETTRQTNGARNLQAMLDEQGITREEFLPSLRTSLLAEKLARQAFGIADRQDVPYEKTQLWIEDCLEHASIRTAGLPLPVLAEVDGERIDEVEFGRRYLVDQKARRLNWLEEFIDSRIIFQAASNRGIEVGPAEIDAGIRERERQVLEDPRYGGATLRELLEKTGRSLSWFRTSHEFQSQVLLERMLRERYPDGRLERYYLDHQGEFDRLYGPSVHLRGIFLKAGYEGAFSQGFVPRLYEDAEAELSALRERIVCGKATLADLAGQRSEHPSRAKDGDLGFVNEAHPQLGELARVGLEAEERRAPLGPVRTAEGVYLFEVLSRREKPGYAEIQDEVLAHAAGALFEELKGEVNLVRGDTSADR